MQWLIWIVSALMLMLWSGMVWLGYSMTNIALTLPWQQATAALGQLQIPELIKPFIDPILLIFAGGSWTVFAESFAPLMQWLGTLLQGSAGWLTAALPLLAWIIWALGALLLLGVAAVGSAAFWFTRKKQKLA
jgi:hypothetical protein